MATDVRRLTDVNDFGLVTREADDVAVCSGGGAYDRAALCKLVDDAVVYYQKQGQAAVGELFRKMGQYPPGLPNMPPGRIPEFYRAIAAMRFSQELGGRALTLREMLFVLESIGGERNREDDYYATRTLVKAVMNLPLSPQEQSFIAERGGALAASQQAAAKPGGLGPVVALTAGGAVVGGPPGAAVGLVVGLLSLRK